MMLPTTLAQFFVPFASLFLQEPKEEPDNVLRLELRQLHAVSSSAQVVFADVRAPISSLADNTYTLRSRRTRRHRPASLDAFSQARTASVRFAQTLDIPWDEDEVEGPDVESRETLLQLAKITHNAYVPPDDPQWYDLGGEYNVVRWSALHYDIY